MKSIIKPLQVAETSHADAYWECYGVVANNCSPHTPRVFYLRLDTIHGPLKIPQQVKFVTPFTTDKSELRYNCPLKCTNPKQIILLHRLYTSYRDNM